MVGTNLIDTIEKALGAVIESRKVGDDDLTKRAHGRHRINLDSGMLVSGRVVHRIQLDEGRIGWSVKNC